MWPPEALEFLRELEDNNDRDWFRANRARYDADVLGPGRELAAALEKLGAPHVFRPYNDTRFHARPPIKEQLGIAIGYGAAGGFYVELSLDGLQVAPPVLKRAPRGYPPDHPRVEHLRRKHLTVHCRHELAGWLHEPRCAEVVRDQLEAGRPLVAWLGKHVGPAAARPRPG